MNLLLFWYVLLVLSSIYVINISLDGTMYMDEIFHIKQVSVYYYKQAYTQWDPKITTFPGLYYLSLPYLHTASMLSSLFCTLNNDINNNNINNNDNTVQTIGACNWSFATVLRLFNVLFALLLPILCKIIMNNETLTINSNKSNNNNNNNHNHKQQYEQSSWLRAYDICLNPILFYFHFLYYTDSSSLFFTLLTLYYSSKSNSKLCGLSGLSAVLMRQTNIIWVAFAWASMLLRRYENNNATTRIEKKPDNIIELLYSLVGFTKYVFRYLIVIIKYDYVIIVVILLFISFVVGNDGSIVLGDRENHKLAIHITQIFYFILYYILFNWTFLFTKLPSLYERITTLKGVLYFLLCMIICMIIVYYYTILHPFLLADNRHLVFYIVKDIGLKYTISKYIIIPLYLYGAFIIFNHLKHTNSLLWILMFTVCVSASVVFSPLVEPRYFITPCVLLQLYIRLPVNQHNNPPQNNRMIIRSASLSRYIHIICNSIIIIMLLLLFMYKTSTWSDGSIGRLMW